MGGEAGSVPRPPKSKGKKVDLRGGWMWGVEWRGEGKGGKGGVQ